MIKSKGGICFYVFGFPPDFSGATTHAIKLAKKLRDKGVESTFISYTYNEKLVGNSVHEGFPLRRFYRDKSDFKYNVSALKHLFLSRNEFTTLYINGNDGQFWTAMYFSIFCLLLRKRLLIELNMDYEDPLSIRGTKLSPLKRFFSKFVHTYIPLSSSTFHHMKKEYPELHSKQICNGVDENVFFPLSGSGSKVALRKALDLPEEGKLVVTCGAVCKRKGTDFLINSWANIIEREVNAHFVLIGPYETTDGTDKAFVEEILALAKSTKFKGSVIFTGLVSNVNEYLRASDIFIFAGRQEGSPNVLREAMASGLPVVSLQLEGITDDMVVDNETGFVIPVDQKLMSDYENKVIDVPSVQKAFISKLYKLLNDDNLVDRFGRHGRNIITQNFSLTGQADNLITLIK